MGAADTAQNKILYVDAKRIAALFGVTVRRIQQLTQDGVIQTEAVGKRRRYNLDDTVLRYITHLQNKLSDKGGPHSASNAQNEARKLCADADYKQAKAEIAQLELAEFKGNMHRSEDVEAMTNDLVFAVRSMLLSLPGRLAIDLAPESSPSEVSERIRREVEDILRELATYKYDPDAYKKRVRDRQGKNFEEDEVGEE